jgi:gentisate 1,2-dioxygenase
VAEELILVLEGKGYDIHDGERWNWQQGDLICVPAMTTHQHFSLGDSPALLLSSSPSVYADLGLGGIEQFEDAPES